MDPVCQADRSGGWDLQLSAFSGYQGGRRAARAVADLVDHVMGVFGKGFEWPNVPYVIQ